MVVGDAGAESIPLNSAGNLRPVQSRTSSLPLAKGHQNVKPPPADEFHSDIPPIQKATDIALAALYTLPTPILVLSSSKTVLLANNAVKRLLGVDKDVDDSDAAELLNGQSLSQLGIDMVSHGIPIWVSWEKFLDNLAQGPLPASRDGSSTAESSLAPQNGETTPTSQGNPRGRSPTGTQVQTQHTPDTVVDVVVSGRQDHLSQRMRRSKPSKRKSGSPATCRMIISIWKSDGQRFFTLTFTSSAAPSSTVSQTSSSVRNPSSHSNRSSQSSQSQLPASTAATSQVTSPSPTEMLERVSFPSINPPPQCAPSATVSDFHKVLKMKDAMLRAVEIPLIAMWRDESVVYPNQAARKLLEVEADASSENAHDFMSRFKPWTPDFSREHDENTNPIVALCRKRQPFTNWQVGMLDEKTGKRSTFEISGHPIFDERNGEFLAGMVAFKDITEYTEQIAVKTAENEEQFRLICDMMPQMIWTATPEGLVNYWSQRWYDYTGLTPATSLGSEWVAPFHEEDMPATFRRWAHSLATGDEYATEYRCKNVHGEWRWMLGRALPLRDHKTGKILRWFGTCTDIQDVVDAKSSWQTARKQLLDVLRHSQMTLWILDRDWKVTFYEGDFAADDAENAKIVGSNVLDILGMRLSEKAILKFRGAVENILSGVSDLEILENESETHYYRSKLVPLKGNSGPNGMEDENRIFGVIVIGSDVTGLRRKELENITLLANEAAAKEASKMKSSFLAVSHFPSPLDSVLLAEEFTKPLFHIRGAH